MFDFIVIGDLAVDRLLRITDSTIVDSIDPNAHTVTLPYPSKVRLAKAPITIGGGNSFNAVKTLSKLGLQTALYTVVGTDEDGQRMLEQLKQLGVDCSLVQTDEVEPTNNSFILSIGSDRVLFSHHHQREYKLPELPETRFVYLTSVGENDKLLFDQVIANKQKRDFKLVFSPGTLQTTEEFSDIKAIMAVTDYLIVNKQEAKVLSRLASDSNENLLSGLAGMGPKNIIITRAAHGSIAFDGQNTIKVGALQVPAVETTGAGDTYSATVAAALSLGVTLETAMQWGAVNAAQVISSIGVDKMLDRATLEANLQTQVSNLVYTEPTVDETPLKSTITESQPA